MVVSLNRGGENQWGLTEVVQPNINTPLHTLELPHYPQNVYVVQTGRARPQGPQMDKWSRERENWLGS